jgi:hypothetical protein
MSKTLGVDVDVRRMFPGKIITGDLERRGARADPEVQRADQVERSREQIRAVRVGAVTSAMFVGGWWG